MLWCLECETSDMRCWGGAWQWVVNDTDWGEVSHLNLLSYSSGVRRTGGVQVWQEQSSYQKWVVNKCYWSWWSYTWWMTAWNHDSCGLRLKNLFKLVSILLHLPSHTGSTPSKLSTGITIIVIFILLQSNCLQIVSSAFKHCTASFNVTGKLPSKSWNN